MSITLDEVLLDGLTSSIAIKDSGGDELAIAADGSIAITDNGGSITVDAVDLDIRDLTNASDSVAIGDATNIIDVQVLDSAFDDTGNGFILAGVRQDASGSPVSADGDAHPLVFNNDGELKVAADLTSDIADDAADSGNPIKIGGRGVSGLLTALSATNDRFDMLGDLFRRQFTNHAYNVEIEMTTETVGTSAAEIVSTPMVGRMSMTIQNASNSSVWLGHDAGVTSDDASTGGLEIKKNTSYTDDFGENINVFMIANAVSRTVKVLEKG